MEYTTEFNLIWAAYPKRAGSNPKIKAFKVYNARLKDGYSRADLLLGVQKYNKFCTHTNKLKTEFVMMAATFFNGDEHFLEDWELPVDIKGETFEDKARRLGITAKVGESMEFYKQRVMQTRG